MDIQYVLQTLAEKRPIFHNEADFQHALAWELREHYDCKMRLERRIDIDNNRRTYLDILAEVNGRRVAIELKYKMRAFECKVQDEEFSLLNQGAQDIGRYDVLKDLQRLELMIKKGFVDEGCLIFLTNDSSYHTVPILEKSTVDGAFRIHEGREINGSLSWSECAGAGTMKGREDVIEITGKYTMNWNHYSQLDHTAQGSIKSLVIYVDSECLSTPAIKEESQEPSIETKFESSPNVIFQLSDKSLEIYKHICSINEIPISQFDLRDKLLERFKADGYHVQINRDFSQKKVDIWAEKGIEQLAVEVRFKTGLLNTIYNGKAIHLKNQAAQDISRYDFLKDLEKLENVIRSHPDARGYAVFITNDHTYWEKPNRTATVDADFRIYRGRVIHGLLSWKHASSGTTDMRESTIDIKGYYKMDWKPIITLGSGKNERFKVLMVEVYGDQIEVKKI